MMWNWLERFCLVVLSIATCVVTNIASAAAPGQEPAPRVYKSYDYKETAENMVKEVRLSIPDGPTTVRGILVVSNPMGGDTRQWHTKTWYGEFVHLHDFAFLGTKGFTSHIESLQVMQHALEQIARDSNHAELVHVPYVTTGFSAGGGFASRLLVEVPERVIGCVPVSSRLNFTGKTPTQINFATPGCVIAGELEAGLPKMVEPVLAGGRPKGALWGWMTVQNAGHTMSDQDILALAFLDACIRLRYPADADVRKGPVKLKTLDEKTGWVADNTTWKSGLTTIAPARDFKGPVEKSSWLPSEDVACIYRAYATHDRPLRITLPTGSGTRRWEPGCSVEIKVDDSKIAGWKKLELFDGAKKLGELAAGPAQFTTKDLSPGLHVFSVLGTDASGSARCSNPVLVLMSKP